MWHGKTHICDDQGTRIIRQKYLAAGGSGKILLAKRFPGMKRKGKTVPHVSGVLLKRKIKSCIGFAEFTSMQISKMPNYLGWQSLAFELCRTCNDIVSGTSFELFMMRQLQCLGLNEQLLMMFFRSHILTFITFSAQDWFSFVSDGNVAKLDQIQCRAIPITHPDGDYEKTTRLSMEVPIKLLDDDISRIYYHKIINDEPHPLHRTTFQNTSTGTLSLLNNHVLPALCSQIFAYMVQCCSCRYGMIIFCQQPPHKLFKGSFFKFLEPMRRFSILNG